MVQKRVMRSEEEMTAVIKQYGDQLFRLAYARVQNPSDAEDIIQEVFLKYLVEEKEFTKEDHRKAWLIRVTINTGKSLMRSAWKKHTAAMTNDMAAMEPEYREVKELVAALPEKYRVLIHLYYYEEYSVKEIAAILGLSESAVKTRLYRARKELKLIL